VEARAAAEAGAGRVEHWAPEPEPGSANPATTEPATAQWPLDPLGARSAAVHAGAELVRAALRERAVGRVSGTPDPPGSDAVGSDSAGPDRDGLRGPDPEAPEPDDLGPGDPAPGGADPDPERWAADVDVLLAERVAQGTPQAVALPAQLSVSRLVELALNPAALAARLRRPLPLPPNPHARRGTAFHAWLEQRWQAQPLLDVDELPGAADAGADDAAFAELRAAFEASEWAARTPAEIEVPFEIVLDGTVIRGRMDAVFGDDDTGWTVVDWKTGAVPDGPLARSAAVQLAAYRLAWGRLRGIPDGDLARVRAVFHYVPAGITVEPTALLDAQGLRRLMRAATSP
jgi:DNA helicase-2/ATP-dependent DNA helicase PcrA